MMIFEIRHVSTETFREYVRDQNGLLLVIDINHSDK